MSKDVPWVTYTLLAGACLVALSGCTGGNNAAQETVTMPVANVPGSSSEVLRVVMPDGTSKDLEGDVSVSTPTSTESVGVVAVVDSDRGFGWLAAWPAWFETDATGVVSQQTRERQVGPISTAVQLVLGTPHLFTLDAGAQREFVTALEALPEVRDLASFLEEHAAGEGDPLTHPEYPATLTAAVAAAVDALDAYQFETIGAASMDGAGLESLRFDPSDDMTRSSLGLDQVFTRIHPDGGRLEVAWDASVRRAERGLTYYGQLYRLEPRHFADESSMRSHFFNAPWSTDVLLDAASEPRPIALQADTTWVYADLVSVALNALEGLVIDDPGVALDEPGVYAAHLYSCSAGINLAEIVRENRRNDIELLRNWPSDEASMVAPCVMFVLESTFNVLSVYVDLDETLRDEDVVSLVSDVTATVLAAGDRAIQTRDLLPIITETAKTAASMVVANLLDVAGDQGVRGVGQIAFKNLAALLNIGNIISNGGQLGARLTASAGMTPWEGVIVVVGDPWASEPVQTRLADDFDDGDFASNPSWNVVNFDDRPGSVTVSDGYVRWTRSGARGNGGAVGIDIEVDIPVTDTTTAVFDVLATSRDVGDGCGWTCGEFPANVMLYLENDAAETFRLRYVFNYGTALENKERADYRQIATAVPRDEWVRDVSFNVRDGWPEAARITRVHLFGNGWNFDGGVDNVAVVDR